jgi:hypothetical protein
MNPKVASGGRSFRGAFLYYLHDPKADTRERIAWTHSVNMFTDDPERAWKVMAYTAMHQDRLKAASGQRMTGRKTEKPVLAYSLSWHPDQKPDPAHMRETALQSLKVLGWKTMRRSSWRIATRRTAMFTSSPIESTRSEALSRAVRSPSASFLILRYNTPRPIISITVRSGPRTNGGARKAKPPATMTPALQVHGRPRATARVLLPRWQNAGSFWRRATSVSLSWIATGRSTILRGTLRGVRAKDLRERLSGIDLAALPDAKTIAADRAAEHAATKIPHLNENDLAHLTPDFTRLQSQKPNQKCGLSRPKPAPEKQERPDDRRRESDRDEARAAALLNRLEEKQQREREDLNDRYSYRIERERSELRAAFDSMNVRLGLMRFAAVAKTPRGGDGCPASRGSTAAASTGWNATARRRHPISKNAFMT